MKRKKKTKKIEPCGGRIFTEKCGRLRVKWRVKWRVRLGGTHIMKNSTLVNCSIMMGVGTLLIFGMQITNF